MRAELSDFILSFERLSYREVDYIVKKLWMAFEVAWEKECLEKECIDCHKDAAEHINASEKLLKESFMDVMKSLTLSVYEAKADALKKERM